MKIIATLLLLAASAAAQNVICAGRVDCKSETSTLSVELAKYSPVVPHEWTFIIQSDDAFKYWTTRQHLDTVKAFSELKQRRTWVAEGKLSPDHRQELQRFIAHEIGHVFCNEVDERRADEDGFRLLMGQRDRKQVCK